MGNISPEHRQSTNRLKRFIKPERMTTQSRDFLSESGFRANITNEGPTDKHINSSITRLHLAINRISANSIKRMRGDNLPERIVCGIEVKHTSITGPEFPTHDVINIL